MSSRPITDDWAWNTSYRISPWPPVALLHRLYEEGPAFSLDGLDQHDGRWMRLARRTWIPYLTKWEKDAPEECLIPVTGAPFIRREARPPQQQGQAVTPPHTDQVATKTPQAHEATLVQQQGPPLSPKKTSPPSVVSRQDMEKPLADRSQTSSSVRDEASAKQQQQLKAHAPLKASQQKPPTSQQPSLPAPHTQASNQHEEDTLPKPRFINKKRKEWRKWAHCERRKKAQRERKLKQGQVIPPQQD